MSKKNEGANKMFEFSLWKHLRKHLRRRRGSSWMLGAILAFMTSLLLAAWSTPVLAAESVEKSTPEASHSSIITLLKEHKGPLTVTLHREYICGEETRPLGRMDAAQIIRLLMSHPEWKAVLAPDGETVLLEQQIDDFSDECRSNAYIGIDKQGNLTLFDGLPKKEKVVRTFFQLDVQYMESSLPQEKVDQLAQGIKISDVDEYNSVLSTFSDFALQEHERVMNPTY